MEGNDEVTKLIRPVSGIRFQKKISDKWAITLIPNVSLMGNIRNYNTLLSITKAKSESALVNIDIKPMYYFSDRFYISAGPSVSYLIWSRGTAYKDEMVIRSRSEINHFNRWNVFATASLGFSDKLTHSRKNAPIQIDVLWFVELRSSYGLTNILKEEILNITGSQSYSLIALVTGFNFGARELVGKRK